MVATTGFQNATLQHLCTFPYVQFVATRNIAVGEEIWASYGPGYPYDHFMRIPAIRDFFCNRIGIECSVVYAYESEIGQATSAQP
jgi:hypothetical protein